MRRLSHVMLYSENKQHAYHMNLFLPHCNMVYKVQVRQNDRILLMSSPVQCYEVCINIAICERLLGYYGHA